MGKILSGEVYFERERRLREMKMDLAAHTLTPPEVLDSVARSGIDGTIAEILCGNPYTPPKTLEYLSTLPCTRRRALIDNEETPDSVIVKIARHGRWLDRWFANREIRRRNAARRRE